MEYGNIEGKGTITPLPADFDITSQADGTILYFNGTNWVILTAGTADQVLTAHGASAPTWEDASGGGGVPTNIQYFLSSATWTKPADVTTVFVKAWGGGAGVNGTNWRGGGGGGGYCEGLVVVSGNVTVTVGAGGANGGGGNDGLPGGLSRFAGDTTLTANGGFGATGQTGGLGGTATGGSLNLTGGQGGSSVNGTDGTWSGTGGSSFGTTGGEGRRVIGGGTVTQTLSMFPGCGAPSLGGVSKAGLVIVSY